MKTLNIMAGPPRNKEMDEKVIKEFLSNQGEHFVCGGTTATLVAKYLKAEIHIPIEVDGNANGSPFGYIDGGIIATEGIITLSAVADALFHDVAPSMGSGEHRLYTSLLQSDVVNIFLGRSRNPAHSGKISFDVKEQSVIRIKNHLIKLNKKVNLYQN